MKLSNIINPDFHKNIKAIFLGILLTNISTFMLMAFLTIYLNTMLDYSPTSIGIVLTVLLISQRGFTFFGGILADKFGVKRLMIIGLLLRSVGYFSYIFAYDMALLILSSVIVGVGGALISPSLSASIAIFSGEKKVEAFAYQGIVVNIAATLGPLIGAVIYEISFSSIFIITSATHLIFIFIINRIPYDKSTQLDDRQKVNIFRNIKTVISDRSLLIFTIMTSGFWYMQTQLNLTIPLYISDFYNNESLIGWIYGLNGFLVIILQYKIIRYLQKKFKKELILVIGHLIFSLSFGLIPVFPDYYSLIIFTILFSIGGMCIVPLIDDITSTIAPKELIASYMGFVSFGWAIGGSLGNMTGGLLYQFFYEYGNINILWFTYFTFGIINTIFLLIFVNGKLLKIINSRESA